MTKSFIFLLFNFSLPILFFTCLRWILIHSFNLIDWFLAFVGNLIAQLKDFLAQSICFPLHYSSHLLLRCTHNSKWISRKHSKNRSAPIFQYFHRANLWIATVNRETSNQLQTGWLENFDTLSASNVVNELTWNMKISIDIECGRCLTVWVKWKWEWENWAMSELSESIHDHVFKIVYFI